MGCDAFHLRVFGEGQDSFDRDLLTVLRSQGTTHSFYVLQMSVLQLHAASAIPTSTNTPANLKGRGFAVLSERGVEAGAGYAAALVTDFTPTGLSPRFFRNKPAAMMAAIINSCSNSIQQVHTVNTATVLELYTHTYDVRATRRVRVCATHESYSKILPPVSANYLAGAFRARDPAFSGHPLSHQFTLRDSFTGYRSGYLVLHAVTVVCYRGVLHTHSKRRKVPFSKQKRCRGAGSYFSHGEVSRSTHSSSSPSPLQQQGFQNY